VRAYEPLLRAHARGRLLDLGCGPVPYFGIYGVQIRSCVCIDWPQSGYGSRHVDAFADLNRSLPLRSGAFDTVLLTDVLEHIARPHALLREIARVLAPDGVLVLASPFLYGLHEQPHDYYRYTEFALRRLCEESDLEVISLAPYGGARDVVLDILAKHLAFSPALAAIATGAGRLLSWPLRPLARRTADRFPLGYCLVARLPAAAPSTSA
jgi:SAM-dependent methyltransferase